MGDEERIASIIGEWVEARNRGERRDPEEVARAHPELADELLRRFSVLVGMEHALRTDGDAVLRTLPLDRYRDYRPVGDGGMGIVYWALDTDLNREVALKIVRPDGGGGAERSTPDEPIGISPPGHDTPASKAFETLKSRFLQEAWVTGGMAHPGIVPVYELGQTPDGIPYYTMRFVKGNRTLASAIDEVRDRPMDDRLALLEPFLKVCDTMSYAHAHGVIHRDLKPENVALGEFGEVVVLDWGLAKTRDGPDTAENLWQERIREFREATDLRTLAGALGTPGYMSPEAALGGAAEVDERSDVYSLGVVLYQLLTGQLPYAFESFIELARRLQGEDPPQPSDVNPQVPVGLSELCARALSRASGDRPASAEVLAREIREWQARRAEDLEIAGLLREARGAIEGTAGLRGEDVLRPLDRAGAACSRVMQKRPGSPDAVAIQKEIDRLRERGIAEREKLARGRLMRRGGVVLLVVATVVTVVFATVLESRRRRAEDAERVAARERDEKDAAYRRAEGLRLAAESRAVLPADSGLALALAVEAGKLHRGPQIRNALQGAVRHHRGQWTLPGRGSEIRISPDSRFLVAWDDRETWVVALGTREVAARFIEQRLVGFGDDGSLMATVHRSGVSVWNTRTWEPVIEIEVGESFPGADLSPDGAHLLTRGDGKGRDVTLWDVRTGRRHRTLEGHSGEVQDARFSDDGSRLLTVSQADRTTRVWDVATGAPLLVIRGDDDDLEDVGPNGERDPTAFASALFTTDGSRIVTLSANGTIRVWDGGTGEQLGDLEDIPPYVYPLKRAKDRDRFLICAMGRGMRNLVWEPMTGRRISMQSGFWRAGLATTISADGGRVLSVWGQDQEIRIFNADSGEEVETLPGGSAEFSPDGRWIATASRNGDVLRLWGARTREGRLTLDLTRRGGIESAWLGDGGGRVTTFGREDRTALVRDVATGRILSAQTVTDGSWGEPSPDGSVAVLRPDGESARLVEVATGRTLTDLERPLSLEALAYSRDGRLLAGGFRLHAVGVEEVTRVVDTATGHVVADIPGDATSATFDRTGNTLVLSRCAWFEGTRNSFPRIVEVYDLEAGKILWSVNLPPGQPVDGIELDTEADRLLAWSFNDAFVFDVGVSAPRWTTRVGGGLRWAGLSADGERIGVHTDALALRVFDVAAGGLLFSVPKAGDARWVVRWSPRARRLLTADRDGVARIRDGDTGEVLTVLRGHEMSLSSAEYSTDGGRIVTVSFDQTAKVWDAATGRELLSVGGHANERVSDFRFLRETGDVLVVAASQRETGLGRAEVRDPADWALVARFPEPVRSFFAHPGSSFLVSPDGALVARQWGGTVWNARTGQGVSHSWTDADRKRFTPMRGRSSPDGRWRLDNRNDRNRREDDSRVQVLDAVTGERRTLLEGHGASVTSARFGPEGRLVVTASMDRTARVWDARTGAEIMSLDHPDEVRDAAISPEGTFLVTLSKGKLRRFPMDPFAVAVSLGPRPLTVAERRRFEIGAPGEPEEPTAAQSEPGSGLRLYKSLLEALGDEKKVRERLVGDDSLDPVARDAARKIRLRASDHARRLLGRALRIAVVPEKTLGEYEEALRLARVASRLDPEDPDVLAALAKAMIRTGSVKEGVTTLERVAPARAEATGHGIPTDSAFLALGYHSLGREEEARAALARCRELLMHPDYDTEGSRAVLVPLLTEVEVRLK